MKLTRKLTALAMAVLLAFTLTACSPKAWAQDTVVKLVKAMGLVEESEDDDTDTTTKAAAGGSVEFPEGMDTSAARVVTYPQDNTLYVSFNSIANRSTEYFVAGGDSMTVTGCATTEASSEKYMYFKIAFWELSDDKTSTSYVQGSTIYYCADGSAYQYNVTGLTPCGETAISGLVCAMHGQSYKNTAKIRDRLYLIKPCRGFCIDFFSRCAIIRSRIRQDDPGR